MSREVARACFWWAYLLALGLAVWVIYTAIRQGFL
jgi:hypothetical protein